MLLVHTLVDAGAHRHSSALRCVFEAGDAYPTVRHRNDRAYRLCADLWGPERRSTRSGQRRHVATVRFCCGCWYLKVFWSGRVGGSQNWLDLSRVFTPRVRVPGIPTSADTASTV